MKISIIRGAFLNPFELQNYILPKKKFSIQAISSHHPLSSKIDLPLKKLWSPTDLPNFPFKYQLLNRLLPDAHYLLGLNKAIKGTDIAHVAETYYYYTYQAIKAKEKGLVKKVVSTIWEVIPHNNETLPGRRRLKQYCLPRIDQFLAVTQLAKQSLLKEGVPEKKITVLPMGVDTRRFKPHFNKSKRINITFIGRFVTQKGIGDLLAAFPLLKSSKINLNLVGSGPLKKIIPSHPRIFVKSLPYSQIHRIYNHTDIFCLPSRTTSTWKEQYGMVLVEALSSGLPIVTTKTGAIHEVCGDAALYASPSDPVSLAKQLNRLIASPLLRRRLSRLARRRALDLYDRKKIAARLARIYLNVASS